MRSAAALSTYARIRTYMKTYIQIARLFLDRNRPPPIDSRVLVAMTIRRLRCGHVLSKVRSVASPKASSRGAEAGVFRPWVRFALRRIRFRS